MLDSTFQVEVLSETERPNLLCYLAMHQDYSESFVCEELEKFKKLSEEELGDRIVKNCIKYRHWGVIEHPSITFNVINFPHSVMVQARTHRIGTSFDCLAAETDITTVTKNNKVGSKTIAQLYQIQQQGGKLPLVRNLNEDRGYFTKAHIAQVFKNSYKNLYLVTLENGQQLKCSLDHKIFTPDGWSRLEYLQVGSLVACNGTYVSPDVKEKYSNPIRLAEQLKTKSPKKIAEELGCSYSVIKKFAYKFGLTWEIRRNKNTGRTLDLSSLTDEQKAKRKKQAKVNIQKAHEKRESEGHPNRKHSDDNPKRVYNWQKYHRQEILEQHGNKCVICGSTVNLHCHHKVEVSEDISKAYDIDNFEILCASCHSKEHKCLKTHFAKISSIEFLRNDITYDLEINGKYHNFVADGVVVHNCQSQRYTSKRIVKLNQALTEAKDNQDELLEKVFYFRPRGYYLDREGNKYLYSEEGRKEDLLFTKKAVEHYAYKVENQGYAPEHARDFLTQNIRQHFVVTFNARSLLHFCDLRIPKDAQAEINDLATLIFKEFKRWMPEVAEYYEKKRLGKNLLAP